MSVAYLAALGAMLTHDAELTVGSTGKAAARHAWEAVGRMAGER